MAATDEDPELIPANQDSREATVHNAAVMSGGTLLSRATGLVRVSVTLAALGVTALSDAYNQANTTPNIIYELVLGGSSRASSCRSSSRAHGRAIARNSSRRPAGS